MADNHLVLDPDRVLAQVHLVSYVETLGNQEPLVVPEALVTFGRPIVYEVGLDHFPPVFRRLPDAAAWRYIRVVLPFTLEPLARQRVFTDATILLRVRGDSVAFDLEPPRPVGAGGLALAAVARPIPVTLPSHADEPTLGRAIDMHATGYGTSSMRWTLTDRDRGPLPSGSYVVGAVLQVPLESSSIAGELSANVSIRRPALQSLRRIVVRTQRPELFEAAVAASRPADTARRVRPAVESPSPGIRSVCIASDLEGYSRRSSRAQLMMQRRLVEILTTACDHANLDRDIWKTQPQGDGELAILPPGIDEPTAIADFLTELHRALRDVNQDLNEDARLRLRVSVHQGLSYVAANGYAGEAPVTVCRLRDSRELRDSLKRHPDVDLAIIVSDSIYQDVVVHEPRGLRAADFRGCTITMPDKGFVASAWISLGTPHRGSTKLAGDRDDL